MKITLDDSEIKQPRIIKPLSNKTERKKISRPKRIKLPKQPLTNKQKITKIIFIIIAIIATVVVSYIGYFIYKAYKTGQVIGFNLRPNDIITQDIPKLKRDSTNKYTTVLIVGIDTRGTGNLLNTDSLILTSYNYDTQDIIMTSIPRDLHVQVNPEVFWFNRINSVYSTSEQKNEGSGLLRLREVVTEITGNEIQYHAMIDYKGFVGLIDTLGGIDINVENSFTDYMYPDGTGYKTVRFVKGPQHMDGSTALEYTRSRHSQQNGEGSDFARAQRQQNVLSAVTEKIASGSLLDPRTIMNLFNVIQDNIQISEFTLDEVEAGVDLLKIFQETGETFSFILDPNAGAGRLLKSRDVVSTGAYAIGPVDGLGEYEDIHEYISSVYNDPQLYEEDPLIKIYNTGLGYTETTQKYHDLIEQYPYLKIGYMGTLYNNKETTISYLNNDSTYSHSLESINQYIQPDSIIKPEYITTNLNAEDITILYGKELAIEENITQTTE